MTQQRVILLVGIPGSGKSTWAARQPFPILSTDAIRHEISGDEAEQNQNERVFYELNRRLKLSLEQGNAATIIDATNLRRRDRKPLLKIIREAGALAEAVVFRIPLEVALERNRSRTRQVPEEIITLFQSRFQMPTTVEGFSKITAISA